MVKRKHSSLDLLQPIESKVEYLDPSLVIDRKQSEPPLNRSRTGYGGKIGSSWELKLIDNKWHRVYIMQWSNAGTAYIMFRGRRLLLGSYSPELGR